MDKKSNSLSKIDVLLAVFCNVLFGSAGVAIKVAYSFLEIGADAWTQILFAGIRFFISGFVVFGFTCLKEKKPPLFEKNNAWNVLSVALFYTFLQYIFYYVGLSNTSGAVASLISSSSVFIAVILAHFVYSDDKLNLRKSLGVALGFTGVVLSTLGNGSTEKVSWLGEGFVFLSAFCFVIGSMLNKRATKRNDSYTVSAYNLLFGGGLLTIVGLVGGGNIGTVNIQGVLALAYLIGVSSVGFTIWSGLCKKYPIGKLSVYSFIIPVSGVAFSALFLSENIFKWQYLLALLLVSVSIIAVNYRSEKEEVEK